MLHFDIMMCWDLRLVTRSNCDLSKQLSLPMRGACCRKTHSIDFNVKTQANTESEVQSWKILFASLNNTIVASQCSSGVEPSSYPELWQCTNNEWHSSVSLLGIRKYTRTNAGECECSNLIACTLCKSLKYPTTDASKCARTKAC